MLQDWSVTDLLMTDLVMSTTYFNIVFLMHHSVYVHQIVPYSCHPLSFHRSWSHTDDSCSLVDWFRCKTKMVLLLLLLFDFVFRKKQEVTIHKRSRQWNVKFEYQLDATLFVFIYSKMTIVLLQVLLHKQTKTFIYNHKQISLVGIIMQPYFWY